MHLKKNICAFIVIGLAVGCSKTEPDKIPVARLDNKTLGLEEIRASIDTSRELSISQIQQYVQRWITEETLYREAVERNLDQTDEVSQKLEDVRRQLAINALLDKEIYSTESANLSPQEIRRYYDEHTTEFNLISDAAIVSYVLFKNRDAATEFRNLVVKGTTWRSAVEQRASSIITQLDSSYQTQTTLAPVELWRVASNASLREISYPISAANGYYILVVWKYFKQGQTADISFVEKEISGRLTIERRRKLYDQLIQKLRAKHSIEVFVDSVSLFEKTNAE